jgi:hypothetical protein
MIFANAYLFLWWLWVNDEVFHKFVRFAPDFTSWAATPIKFEIATSELIDFLQQKADALLIQY